MLEKHFNADSKKYEEYLAVCEKLGKEPDPSKIPIDIDNFPYEVHIAFLLHEVLPDRWDGAAGAYLGKDWSSLGALLDSYKIKEEITSVIYFLKAIDNISSNVINKNLEIDRKKQERKSQGKGMSTMNFPKGTT